MVGDFFDVKQTPIYVIFVIQGGRWISQYIWAKGESTEALAGRIANCETVITALTKTLEQGNARLSDRFGDQTKYDEERRSEFEALRAHVHEIQGELRAVRGYKKETWYDRRQDPREPE